MAKNSSPPKIRISTNTPAVDTSAYDGMLLKPPEKTTLVATIGELIPPRAESSPSIQVQALECCLEAWVITHR